MSELTQIQVIDLDVYGRNNPGGGAMLHYDDVAISNAIVFYLTCNQGDYLYQPNSAGNLEQMTFKLMDNNTRIYHESNISNDLESAFGSLITNISVNIISHLEERYFEIEVYYTSIQTNQTNKAIFNIAPKNTIPVTTNITDIQFTGDNLLGFVLVKKDELSNPLIKSMEDGKWYWGAYRFVNFDENSNNFNDIYYLINDNKLLS